jgi:hypothetical protein
MSTKQVTQGVSTKLTAGGATELSLVLLYWLLFSSPWWATLDPAPPAEIWLTFATLVSGAVAYFTEEKAPVVAVEVETKPVPQ